MMLRSKKIGALCCAIALAVTCAVPAFAASSVAWSTPLPPNRGGVDLASGHRNNGTQASVALQTMGGGYTRMYFTVRQDKDGYPDATSTAWCSKQYSTNLSYFPSAPRNYDMILNGGNDKWSAVHVDASGVVNFG